MLIFLGELVWTEGNECQSLCTNTHSNSLLLRDNDNRNAHQTAQQLLNKDMMTQDSKFFQTFPSPKPSKLFGFNISSKKNCVWRSENCRQFVGSKTLDSAIASFL